MSGEVFYGRSVCQLEGSRTAEGIVGRQTADGGKFLPLFRTALKCITAQKIPPFTRLASAVLKRTSGVNYYF